jgi:predicted NUDIX family NTP pyrophosphohydrolase
MGSFGGALIDQRPAEHNATAPGLVPALSPSRDGKFAGSAAWHDHRIRTQRNRRREQWFISHKGMMMGNIQFAALPFRAVGSGVEIMLITTRQKQRWSVPKGSPIGNKKPHRVAEVEAFEEAGLAGAARKRALGSFRHRKQRGKRKLDLEVHLFPMEVRRQARTWPEKGQRRAIWLPAREAARLVHKRRLAKLIARFAGSAAVR